ncbi:hypothetical protein ACROYT_G033348 [Oculina patagonica]
MRRSRMKDAKVVAEDQDNSAVESTADNKMGKSSVQQDDMSVGITFHESKASAKEKLINSQKNSKENVTGKLKRNVTLLQGVSLIVGVMIGSGIFVTPRYVLLHSGSVGMTLLVWITSGVMATLGALCYCELGTLIQRSGGELTYIREALGLLPGFLVSWTMVLILKPASVAIITLSFASYAIQPFLSDSSIEPEALIKFIATISIVLITSVNCVSSRWAGQMQIVFMIMKLLAIGIIVLIGATRIASGRYENFKSPFKGTNQNIGEIAHAFFSGLWAYDGWNQLNYVTEELQNPHKNLPRGVMIALPLVTLCYTLVNVAYLSILTPAEVLSSTAVAVSVAEKVHPTLVSVMPLFVACSCYGAANGSIFTNGRVVCSAAKEGHMPRFLATISERFHTPLLAIMFPSFISICMLMLGDLDSLLSCFSFVAWIFLGSTFLSLLVLRWKRPDDHRPYKVWIGIPVVMVMVSCYLVIAPLLAKPQSSAVALAFVLSGVPVYFCFVNHNK